MAKKTFDKVCYFEGDHWSVKDDGQGGEEPDQRLFLEDDGSYRLATEADPSWHDRKHERFATVEMEDGGGGIRVSPEELADIQSFLQARRGGDV